MWVHRDSREAQGPDLSLLRGGLVGFGYTGAEGRCDWFKAT